MKHKTSYIYDIYPVFGQESKYQKMSKTELINLIRRLCSKYTHVRLKFLKMDTELNFLRRSNTLLEKKVEFLRYSLNNRPNFKYLTKTIKNNRRQRGEIGWDIIQKKADTSTTGKSSAQKASGRSGTAKAARLSRENKSHGRKKI